MKSKIIAIALLGSFVAACQSPQADLRPKMIRWGASAAEMEAALEGKCEKGFVTRPIDPPFLPVVETIQVQIDCDGLEFLDGPRWAEFVIGDDRLQMVWIMIDKAEEEDAIAALETAYGPETSRNADFVAFLPARAAWRFEPTEVLYYAPELDDWLGPALTAN